MCAQMSNLKKTLMGYVTLPAIISTKQDHDFCIGTMMLRKTIMNHV